MSDKEKALFLLEAIGELSDKTVAEAKTAARHSFRRIAAAAAAVVIIGTMAAFIALGGHAPGEEKPVTASESTESSPVISLDSAVKAAKMKLSERGITADLGEAYLISEGDRINYKIRLRAEKITYDCLVDAQSGEVIEISESTANPERSTEGSESGRTGNTEIPGATDKSKSGPEATAKPDTVKPTAAPKEKPSARPTVPAPTQAPAEKPYVMYESSDIRYIEEDYGLSCLWKEEHRESVVGGDGEYMETVAMLTAWDQLEQFYTDIGGDLSVVKNWSKHFFSSKNIIAVAYTRTDNSTISMVKLNRDKYSGGLFPYFGRVNTESSGSIITDIRLYSVSKEVCEIFSGFYMIYDTETGGPVPY